MLPPSPSQQKNTFYQNHCFLVYIILNNIHDYFQCWRIYFNKKKKKTFCDLIAFYFETFSCIFFIDLNLLICILKNRFRNNELLIYMKSDQEGKAAIHLAAEQGHQDIVDILLAHKAFVNTKTKLGLTPLHLSAQSGSARLVRLLVETHQASVDALSLVRTESSNIICDPGTQTSLKGTLHFFWK